MANAVIPLGADRRAALHGLVRKRAEHAGEIERRQGELRGLIADLNHLDATIRLFNPDVRIEAIRPKRRPAPLQAAHGEVTKIVFDTLRDASFPLTSRQLAAEVATVRGLTPVDAATLTTLAKRVRACLRPHRLAERVRAVQMEEGPQGWELATRRVRLPQTDGQTSPTLHSRDHLPTPANRP